MNQTLFSALAQSSSNHFASHTGPHTCYLHFMVGGIEAQRCKCIV